MIFHLLLSSNFKTTTMSNVFSAEVPHFKPSQHGFKFTNSFQISDLPLDNRIKNQLKLSTYGLCGGMAHCAHELFLYNEPIPAVSQPPRPKSGLYEYLVGGLMDSFGVGLRDMNKILEWWAMPDGETKLPNLTKFQLAALKLLLKRGKLVQLMICYNTQSKDNMWDNHQVLAYKIEESNNQGKIWLYEPNNAGSDEPHIAYTLDSSGVHMTEYHANSNDEEKTVHGFFVVMPRIENPLSKPAYLYFKGVAFLVDRMKNNLRKSIYEIVDELKKYSQLTPLEIFRLLKDSGYGATDIARVAKDALKLSAEIVVNLLYKVSFSASQVVGALHIVFKKIASWLVSKLIQLGYKLADIAKSVQDYFRMKLLDLVKLFKRLAIKLADIVKMLKDQFQITNLRTLATMLRDAKYGVTEIIRELKKLGLSIKDAVLIMRNDFKWSVVATARIIKDQFGNKPKDVLLALWQHGNASLSEMISTAKSVFGWGKTQLLKLI